MYLCLLYPFIFSINQPVLAKKATALSLKVSFLKNNVQEG